MENDKNFYLMFGRLEGKVDTLLSQQGGISKRLDEHDKRLGELETLKEQRTGILTSFRWGWIVAAAAIGAFSEEIKGWIMR